MPNKNADNKELNVECGQPFSISLESMPASTGYSWALAMLHKGILLVSTEIQQHMSGTCGHVVQIFHFLAVTKGEYATEFQLIRPWQPGTPGQVETYSVKVVDAAPKDALKSAMGQYATRAMVGDACSVPTTYYGIPPMQSAVLKYGIPTATLKYGIDPVVRYGFPLNTRYAAPQRFQDGCMAMPYGVRPDDCCC
jgi:predicted secreted protein